jgi:hypothetical protein
MNKRYVKPLLLDRLGTWSLFIVAVHVIHALNWATSKSGNSVTTAVHTATNQSKDSSGEERENSTLKEVISIRFDQNLLQGEIDQQDTEYDKRQNT